MKNIAFIPARQGSERVKQKNIRLLAGHPLIAYAITTALESGLFERVLVSTDSKIIQTIAQYYGADAPFLRPKEYATSTSPDIEWIKHAFGQIGNRHESFAILRPTSPFRSIHTIRRAFDEFLSNKNIDSLRAVELVKQHPGKMWLFDDTQNVINSLLPQDHLEAPWHAGQYQNLPKVYVQNSSLEWAHKRVIDEHNSREGKVIAPFFTQRHEGFAVDYEHDWIFAENMVKGSKAKLHHIKKSPFIF